MIKILDYPHYRDYLRDYFKARKTRNPRFSFAVWKRELGIKSPSTLIMILQGKRQPGPQLTRILGQHLKLNSKEMEYFHSLVLLDKVREKDDALFQMTQERLLQLNSRQSFRKIEVEQFRLYADWRNLLVVECFRLKEIHSLESLRKLLRPRMTRKELQRAVESLLALGLLRKAGPQKYAATGNFESTYDVPSEALKLFHEGALQFVRSSVRDVDVADRELLGCALALSKNRIPELKERIRNFYRQLIVEFETPEGADQVVLLESALVPATHAVSLKGNPS